MRNGKDSATLARRGSYNSLVMSQVPMNNSAIETEKCHLDTYSGLSGG